MKSNGKVVLAVVGVIAVLVVGYFVYWMVTKDATDRRYDVNTHSQSYQQARVAEERSRVQAYNTALDPGQKAQIASTFCSVYLELTQPPQDLVIAHTTICK